MGQPPVVSAGRRLLAFESPASSSSSSSSSSPSPATWSATVISPSVSFERASAAVGIKQPPTPTFSLVDSPIASTCASEAECSSDDSAPVSPSPMSASSASTSSWSSTASWFPLCSLHVPLRSAKYDTAATAVEHVQVDDVQENATEDAADDGSAAASSPQRAISLGAWLRGSGTYADTFEPRKIDVHDEMIVDAEHTASAGAVLRSLQNKAVDLFAGDAATSSSSLSSSPSAASLMLPMMGATSSSSLSSQADA